MENNTITNEMDNDDVLTHEEQTSPRTNQEATSTEQPSKRNTKKLAIIAASIILILLAVVATGFSGSQRNKASQYEKNLNDAYYLMISGGVDAEDTGNLIKSVWYNSIYEKKDSTTDKYTRSNNGRGSFYSDFNDALGNLFSSAAYKALESGIESNQDAVAAKMKQLNDPPKGYDDAYDAVKDCYDAYLELTNLVISPRGSLQTFSSNFNSADSKLANCLDALETYM